MIPVTKTTFIALKSSLLSLYTIFTLIEKNENFTFLIYHPCSTMVLSFMYHASPYMYFNPIFFQKNFCSFSYLFQLHDHKYVSFTMSKYPLYSTFTSILLFTFPPVHTSYLLINVHTYNFNVWTTFCCKFRHSHKFTFKISEL